MNNLEVHKGKKRGAYKTLGIIFVIFILVAFLGISFAAIFRTLRGTKNLVLLSSDLQLYLNEENNLSDVIQGTMTLPVEDFEGIKTESYKFSIENQGNVSAEYTIYLLDDVGNTMPIYALRYNLSGLNGKLNTTNNIENLNVTEGKRMLYSSSISGKSIQDFELRIWLGVQAENDAKNKMYSARIQVEVSQVTNNYYDEILNGCDPVLGDHLIPIVIANDGTVTKANIKQKWYNYTNKEWANAVLLKDKTRTYEDGQIIKEEDIESYFVWIPRYKYKIFNTGNYEGITEISDTAPQTIELVFEDKDTPISNGTEKGEWLSHPAFQAFDSNGFWVGKFESGYDGATTPEEALVNSSDVSKLIIKPNVYSWRNITVGNAFKASYDYLRSDESHMMKNTEWGAVAYLQHSEYGSHISVKFNNNKDFITGYASITEPIAGNNSQISIPENPNGTTPNITLPYNTEIGYTASTTGNISGVYDMSGGAWEMVMGYNLDYGFQSVIVHLIGDFFINSDWDRYYDQYHNQTSDKTKYQFGIMGDGTKEMGPFGDNLCPDNDLRNQGSWYNDYADFISINGPWFRRGGHWDNGSLSGVFAFVSMTEEYPYASTTFRLVLTP